MQPQQKCVRTVPFHIRVRDKSQRQMTDSGGLLYSISGKTVNSYFGTPLLDYTWPNQFKAI